MERNYDEELDSLKKEISEIKLMLQEFTNVKVNEQKNSTEQGRIHKMTDIHSNPNIMNLINNLENICEQSKQSGAITYLGVYESGNRQSTWIRNEVNTDRLLALIENKTAGNILNCIGNNDRLNILLSILKKPMTVAQLVEECGYNSTGQVYHHIKPLIAADLIVEDTKSEVRGTYVVQPHRVQGIIMLLAGISDMIDPLYTQGNWDITE